jgi:glycosyltransferase involved in cell wall biosynthesis
MRILYISYDGMTDPLGQSQVIPYLIGLSKQNQITIISCDKPDQYAKQKKHIETLLKNANIEWIPVLYSTSPSILSKQLNIHRIKQKAAQFCKKHVPDIVHCRSYMAALVGLGIKKRYNVKFIFDMRGFWADERMDGNIWNNKNSIHRYLFSYFKKKEIEFLTTADYTVSLTENAKQEILSWQKFQNNKIPIAVIPCCADLHLFSPQHIEATQQLQLKQNLKITGMDFILTYLGSIGTWYMLDEMLDFFSCLIKVKPEAKFLFITTEPKETILSKSALKGIPKEKLIICAANRNEVPLYLSLSHISIYFIKPCYSKKASSPTKTAEIMGMGIPIITNSGIGDVDEILANSGSGLLIRDFNFDEYIRVIDQISLFLTIEKNEIIKTSYNHFSLEKGIQLYQSIYDQLGGKNQR